MEDLPDKSGLHPEYKEYDRQACFVGHSHNTDWRDDLVNACAEVLPIYSLQPWYADAYFDPTEPLREKVIQAIANARFGIYDISSWQDAQEQWRDPRNVYIELGIAIALNRPTLLLRHTSNNARPLPACLKGAKVLEFSGEITLRKSLEQYLPQWIDAPPEREWYNRFCIFGNRVCSFRDQHPRAHQFSKQKLRCHISDGFDAEHCGFLPQQREEVRGAFEDILSRYDDLEFNYLDELPLADGYQLLLCSYCQNVRSTPFAIYRILPETPASVFITIGISIALETVFKYKIPKVLLVRQEQDLPSLLRGYEVVEAVNSREARRKLLAFIPAVTQKVRETTWKPRPLPFTEHVLVPDVLPERVPDNPPADETPAGTGGSEARKQGLVESVRRQLNWDVPVAPVEAAAWETHPLRFLEDFLNKVCNQVEAVIQREMFTPPSGLTFIPPEYIIYLSDEDDVDWRGEKRRALELGLFQFLSELARELSLTNQLAVKSFAIELRIDATLSKGEVRVEPVWDEMKVKSSAPATPKGRRFKVGQKVVYPNHGIGTIEQIEQKQIGANSLPFYTLRLAATNSLVLVPVANASEVGLRSPISSGECKMLFKSLSADSPPVGDWGDRFKDFSEKMRTGDIFEVADVLKSLTCVSRRNPLTFREQRMLERARYLVASEVAAVYGQPESDIRSQIDLLITRACAEHGHPK